MRVISNGMRILVVTPWFPSSLEDYRGSYIWDSVSALTKLGVKVDILIAQPWKATQYKVNNNEFSDVSKIKYCRYFSIPRFYIRWLSNFSYTFSVSRAIIKQIKREKYNLIHGHTELTSLAIMRVRKFFAIPGLVTIHGIETNRQFWLGLSGKMLVNALNSMDRIIMVGDPLVTHFSKILGYRNNFRVVYNGFRLSDELLNLRKEPQRGECLQILSVSNLIAGKGVDLNLKALTKLKNEGYTNWHYTIIGDGPIRKKLESLVVESGLAEKVTFTGICAHNKVYEYMQKANVFSLPSAPEAFGIVYLEAMANGLLAIAVKGQGAEAFIKHNVNGILVEEKNSQQLAESFMLALKDRVLINKMAVRAKSDVIKQFTWRHQALKMLEVYNEIS